MRISDVLTESEQLDELNWKDVKRGASKVGNAALKGAKALPGLGQAALTGLGKAAGYAAGIPQGLGRAAKQGYSSAVTGIGGGANPLSNKAPKAAPAQQAPVQAKRKPVQSPATQQAPAQAAPASSGGGFSSGFQSQAGAQPAGQAVTPDNQMTPAQQQQSAVTVRQINKAIPTLRTRDLQSVKKNVDATIAKKVKPAPAKPNLSVQQGGAARATPESKQESKKPVVEYYSKFLGQVI